MGIGLIDREPKRWSPLVTAALEKSHEGATVGTRLGDRWSAPFAYRNTPDGAALRPPNVLA